MGPVVRIVLTGTDLRELFALARCGDDHDNEPDGHLDSSHSRILPESSDPEPALVKHCSNAADDSELSIDDKIDGREDPDFVGLHREPGLNPTSTTGARRLRLHERPLERLVLMNPDIQITLSLLLTFGVPLVLALRELLMLRYGGWGRRRYPAEPPAPRPNDENSRPVLPASLIPNLPPINQATREKVLELS